MKAYTLTEDQVNAIGQAVTELRRLHSVNQELLEALKAVSHSVKMAQITGNDWRRELALIENVARAAIAKAAIAKAEGESK